MQPQRITARLAVILSTVVAFGLAALDAGAGDDHLSPELQRVRAATARYHSFEQAEKDGYWIRPGEPCVASPPGTMGVHAINLALMADPTIDLERPEILLYVPDRNGNLKLVGVEYWKADEDQDLETYEDRPSLFGEVFDGPMPGHGNWGMPIHYDMHVWVAAENPSGVFAMFNPSLVCPSTVAETVSDDSPVLFWPHETGALAGTSETFAETRQDGSYYDSSLGGRASRGRTAR